MNIRNFSIIAHIDHGKSTLADRLLEFTNTVPKHQMREQIMDGMELERERGITIKAKTVRMTYKASDGQDYILNLIDTPGHVDFTYEVSRALDSCEGALLVVDASQGVEAQTLANLHLAENAGLVMIPVINKIDLPSADPQTVVKQLEDLLITEASPILVSAKEGKGIPEVLEAVVRHIPAPSGRREDPLSALLFDSAFDNYRGVIMIVRVIEGCLRPGMKITLLGTGLDTEVEEIGVLTPKMVKIQELGPGEVGYMIAGVKDLHDVRIGDTVTETARPTTHIHPGYKDFKPFVFAGLYPTNTGDYTHLQQALEKLHLSDSSFMYMPETSTALGFGFRCGFLGLLHLDIVRERLEREFQLDLLITAPNVVYRVRTKKETLELDNPAKFPPWGEIEEILEPFVSATIVVPSDYVGVVMPLCQNRRGIFGDMRYLTTTRVVLHYQLPLAEIVLDFYDQLKSVSKGYASFDYEHSGFKPGKLTKMEILINNEPVDALCFVVPRESAYDRGRRLVEKIRELIPRQLFEIPIQARVDGKIIARESVRALRKDVLAKCYGGDITRKRKLLEKQKEGRKRMKQFGRVEIPQEAFMAMLKIKEG